MIQKYDEEDFINNLTNPVYSIMQETQYSVLSVITNRIKKIGKLSPTDAQRLSQLVRMEDLKTIESIIAAGTNLSTKQVDYIIEQAAANNDNLADNLYKARNMPPSKFTTDLALLNVVNQAKKSVTNGMVKLSNTSAMNLVMNNKTISIEKAYNYAVNRAIFEVQQGLFDYRTATRSVISELARNGLGVVEYESGYRRRLDSAVNQNIQDGIRQMNMAYREVQGEQFQGDHVFVSFHAMPARDHWQINGSDYTKKEWERVSNSLERQVGQNNCRHYITYGITGISQNPITDKERQDAISNSNSTVQYTTLQKDKDGNFIKKELKKYDGSQKMRQVETNIRQLKDVRNQLSLNDDKIGVSEYERKIKQKTDYYKKISGEIGLKPQMERLRVYTPKK